MKNKFLFYLVALFSVIHAEVERPAVVEAPVAKAKWTILVFMEADNNLNEFAMRNLYDMSSVEMAEDINLLVQWNQPEFKGVWRYKIGKRKLELQDHSPAEKHPDCVKNLVDASKWAMSKCPAEHFAVVLWNHGLGILDPVWKSINHRLSLNELREKDFFNFITELPEELRGILFSESSHTYMNNQQLSESLKRINEEILGGKKIDLVGMDACLMAGCEMAYQIKDFANVFVASEDNELANGWFYSSFLSKLCKEEKTPQQLGTDIVHAFGLFYKDYPYYTQSAVDLQKINSLRDNIDAVVVSLAACKKEFNFAMKNVIHNARMRALQFELPSYIDLHSFYTEIFRQIKDGLQKSDFEEQEKDHGHFEVAETVITSDYFEHGGYKGGSLIQSALIDELKENLVSGMMLLEKFVVIANSSGSSMQAAKGLSIYFPQHRIDSSYFKTSFAKDSLWMRFLQDNV